MTGVQTCALPICSERAAEKMVEKEGIKDFVKIEKPARNTGNKILAWFADISNIFVVMFSGLAAAGAGWAITALIGAGTIASVSALPVAAAGVVLLAGIFILKSVYIDKINSNASKLGITQKVLDNFKRYGERQDKAAALSFAKNKIFNSLINISLTAAVLGTIAAAALAFSAPVTAAGIAIGALGFAAAGIIAAVLMIFSNKSALEKDDIVVQDTKTKILSSLGAGAVAGAVIFTAASLILAVSLPLQIVIAAAGLITAGAVLGSKYFKDIRMTNKLYFIPAALAAVAVIAFGFFALPYISLAAFATASSFVWTAFVATAVFAVITILRSVKFIYGSEAKVSDYIRVTMKSQTLKMALAGFVISAAFMLLSAKFVDRKSVV